MFFESSIVQVKDIVSRYLSAYNAYLPTLYTEGPEGSDPRSVILVEIDREGTLSLVTVKVSERRANGSTLILFLT